MKIVKYLFLHLYFVVLMIFCYFCWPEVLEFVMRKGILFIPNLMILLSQIMDSTLGPVTQTEYLQVEKIQDFDFIDIKKNYLKEEKIEIERPGTKVAIGLTKPKRPKISPFKQNSNAMV